jgi:histone-lysine N-methyltransferase SETD3
LTAAAELKKAVLEKYDALVEKVPLFKAMNITAEQFCTAFILCQSRSLSFEYNGAFENVHNAGRTTALVPLVDMTNHRYPENLDWSFDKQRKVFVLKALNDICRGEEVYLSYGKSINHI